MHHISSPKLLFFIAHASSISSHKGVNPWRAEKNPSCCNNTHIQYVSNTFFFRSWWMITHWPEELHEISLFECEMLMLFTKARDLGMFAYLTHVDVCYWLVFVLHILYKECWQVEIFLPPYDKLSSKILLCNLLLKVQETSRQSEQYKITICSSAWAGDCSVNCNQPSHWTPKGQEGIRNGGQVREHSKV